MRGVAEGARGEIRGESKVKNGSEYILEEIKKTSEEIVRQTQQLGHWIREKSHEAQRQYQRQRQQSIRREEMLQDTLAQLKEENNRLLEERQRLAQETETEQEEIMKMKEEQKKIKEREKNAQTKRQLLNGLIVQISAEIGQLRRVLKQEEEKEEKEGERVRREIEHYASLFDLSITAVEGGSVLFLFKIEGFEYYFQIGVSEMYSIVKASVDEKMYSAVLEELRINHDLFLFIKKMKDIFEEDCKKKVKENVSEGEKQEEE